MLSKTKIEEQEIGIDFKVSRFKIFRENLFRFCRNKPFGAAGGLIVLFVILLAIIAFIEGLTGIYFFSPHDPLYMNFFKKFGAPTAEHWFGNDEFGRDLLSMIISGAKISVYVGFVSVAVGTGIGAFWGLISAYLGGWFDLISQRFVDIMQSIPTLALALVIIASLGSSLNNIVLAISIGLIGGSVRVVRSQALTIRNTTYVESAYSIGSNWARIVFRHILPNCIPPYLIIATGSLAAAILAEASLSFLGVGIPPPHSSWGRMLAGQGRHYLTVYPWISFVPGLAMTLTVLAFNMFGDALRDILDPRLRGSERR
jgi:peptide/nickel transport system permease protein